MFLKSITPVIVTGYLMGIIYSGVGLFILFYGKFLEFNILQKIVFGFVLFVYGLFRLYRTKISGSENKVDEEDEH